MSPKDAALKDDALVIQKMQPGTAIEANFDTLKAHIDSILEDYRDAQYSKRDLKDAKRDRAYLNNLTKELDQRRLEVKRRYMAPVDAFEMKVKVLAAPIKETAAAIDEQIKRMEAEQAAAKRAQIKAHYEDLAGLLVDSVPFERLEDPRWLNQTVNIMTAFAEIEERVEHIAEEEATLTELKLSHPVEAKAEYFATLDISRAIARSKALDDQEAKAARFEEEKAAILQMREDAAQTPAQAPAVVEAVHEPPAPGDGRSADEDTRAGSAEPIHASAPPRIEQIWHLEVTCTRSEVDQLVDWLKQVGIHGRIIPAAQEAS